MLEETWPSNSLLGRRCVSIAISKYESQRIPLALTRFLRSAHSENINAKEHEQLVPHQISFNFRFMWFKKRNKNKGYFFLCWEQSLQ